MTRAIALVTVVILGACGDRSEELRAGPSPAPTETAPTGLPTSVRQWVAVFDTAGHPDDLDPSTEELLEEVGGHIAVQPVQCWDGLAADLELNAGLYAAAVIATSEQELADVVGDVGREPIGTGEYEAFCID